MKLKKLKQVSSDEFSAFWDDGHEGTIRLRDLRDSCPCAGCKGETVLFRTYEPPPPDRSTPGRYEIRAIERVGDYAIKIEWGDGHALGIYTWELLRSLCT